MVSFFLARHDQYFITFKHQNIFKFTNFPWHTGIPGLCMQELDAGLWTLDSERWTLDTGRWTLEAGPWTLDFGYLTMSSGHWGAALWTLEAEITHKIFETNSSFHVK